jgi:hypothetical protein
MGWARSNREKAEGTTMRPIIVLLVLAALGGRTLADNSSIPRANLALWLDAGVGVTTSSSGYLTYWADSSGNGHNVTFPSQPSYVLDAINHQPAVFFNGGGNSGTIGGQVLTSQQFTIFAVATDTGPVSGGFREILSNWKPNNMTSSWFFGTSYNGSRSVRLTDQIGGASDGGHPQQGVGAIPSPSNPFLLSAVGASSYSSIMLNGQPLYGAGPLGGMNLSTSWELGRQGQAGEFWNGLMAEIIVYNGALSNTDIIKVTDYLGSKYQITTMASSVPLSQAGTFDVAFVSGNEFLPRSTTSVRRVILNGGSRLTVRAGETLVAPSGVTVSNQAVFSSSGTITGDFVSSGSISFDGSGPLPSIGSSLVQGNYTQTSTGRSLFDLAGTVQGIGYDFLHVTGGARLEGSLTAALAGGFTPANDSRFDILTADGGISWGSSPLNLRLPVGFSWSLVNSNKTLELLYSLGLERHYAGLYGGAWESSGVWTDRFGRIATGAPKPTADNPVFINRNSVDLTHSGEQAKSVLVNGGKLVIDGTAGGSLTTADYLELGNSLHTIPGDPMHTGTGQGWVQQVHGSNVTVQGDLVLGGKDSVYDIYDTSRLNVAGTVQLVGGSNALFHQHGGTVVIGSAFDAQGHSTDGLLDIGGATTYQMDGGVLDVATIRQTGLFVFNGGQLYVKQMLINTTPAAPTPTYTPAPAPIYSPPTPAAAAGGGGGGGGGGCQVTPQGGFTLERGIVVLDQYSDWRLEGADADLTIGKNSDGGSNGNLVQSGGNVNVDGSLVIGDGPDGKGSYSMSAGSLAVHGQVVLGRNGGIGQYNQTGGTVTIDGTITINESSSGSSKFDITGGTMQALGLLIGGNGGPGELHIGTNAAVRILEDVVIGQQGKVTGSGTFDVHGAHVINNGLIEPGNSPGLLTFDADYVQGSTGTLHMEFAGAATPGLDYDQLQVNGDVTLGGAMILDFIEGFAPRMGDSYTLLTITPGHSLLSDLSDLSVEVAGLYPGWEYRLDYSVGDNTVLLESLSDGVSNVPEPATLSLLVLGGLALIRRRK